MFLTLSVNARYGLHLCEFKVESVSGPPAIKLYSFGMCLFIWTSLHLSINPAVYGHSPCVHSASSSVWLGHFETLCTHSFLMLCLIRLFFIANCDILIMIMYYWFIKHQTTMFSGIVKNRVYKCIKDYIDANLKQNRIMIEPEKLLYLRTWNI